MTKSQTLLLSFCLTATLFAIGFMFYLSTNKVEGSVALANDYIATSTVAVTGTAMLSPNLIQSGSGTLGSVVITGANTGTITIYDGTTTTAHSGYATTTLASFPASIVAGTYTFDVRYVRGLLVEIVGTVATSTITYR